MTPLYKRINPSSPGIARRAKRYERTLRRALALAAKRHGRKSAVLKALYESARVEGVDTALTMRRGIVSFTAPPFRGGLYYLYDWESLDRLSARELAEALGEGLWERVRDKLA